MKKLWIFEKPSQARSVVDVLPKPHVKKNGYIETGDGIVTWCFGHLLEQFQPDDYDEKYKSWSIDYLPIIPEKWKNKAESSKKQQVTIIKGLLKDCDTVVNGGDEGREGQLLVDELLYFLGNKKPVQRYLCGAYDAVSVKRAINNLQPNANFYPLYQAALGRQHADWLIGLNLTRFYTSSANVLLSIGRVQTPTLALVVQRDLDILNFVPKDYWTLQAQFVDPKQSDMKFWTRWIAPGQTLESAEKQESIDQSGEESEDDEDDTSTTGSSQKPAWLDEANRIIDERTAKDIIDKVKNAGSGIVSQYIKKPAEELAPLPFELTSLQVKMNSKYGFSVQETLNACQELYESGYTSYPRTDCVYLPEIQLSDATDVLNAISASDVNMAKLVSGADTNIKSRAWNDGKTGEHHAIIPTRSTPNLSSLSDIQRKAYILISQHYIAQFYPNCKVDKTKIEITIAEERFATSGRVVKSQGWRVVFGADEDSTDNKSEATLPSLTEKDAVDLTDTKIEKKQTNPPPHFTEATLVNTMKHVYMVIKDPAERKKLKSIEGIGRSATRAGIIEVLFKRKFISRQGKKIISSDTARSLITSIPKELKDPGLTARWEALLDMIASGRLSLEDFEKKIIEFLNYLLTKAKNTPLPAFPKTDTGKSSGSKSYAKKTYTKSGSSTSSSKPKPTSGDKCPKCGVGFLIERTSKAGKKFKGCSEFPKCNHTEWPK